MKYQKNIRYEGRELRIFNLILLVLLFISLPITARCISNNLATRMPDLYQYELKSSQELLRIDVNLNEDEMGSFFSDFMFGKKEEFQISYKAGQNTDSLFTKEEQITMERFKKIEDKILLVGVISLGIFLLSFFILFKQNLKELIRRAFLKAISIYLALAGGLLVASLFGSITKLTYKYVFYYEIKEFYILPRLLTEELLYKMEIGTMVLATILMIIVWYFTWKITKPRRIFGSAR